MAWRKCCDGRYRVPIGLKGAASALAQIDEEFQHLPEQTRHKRVEELKLRNSDARVEGGWCKACDMPIALRQWLDENKGFDDFHGAWCTGDCPGYSAAHVDESPLDEWPLDELPLMDA
eukprot:COSAG02_NODE_510_length_20863_cov_139.455233_6_plen_118_part_00